MVWVSGDGKAVEIIDQTKLPFKFEVVALTSAEMAATAIQEMWVRGAPLIGVVAAYGIALGMNHDASDMGLQRYYDLLIKTRPTAINLKWALDRMIDTLKDLCVSERKDVAWRWRQKLPRKMSRCVNKLDYMVQKSSAK